MKFHWGDCPRIYISNEETMQLALDFAVAAKEYYDCIQNHSGVSVGKMFELSNNKTAAEKRLIKLVEQIAPVSV